MLSVFFPRIAYGTECHFRTRVPPPVVTRAALAAQQVTQLAQPAQFAQFAQFAKTKRKNICSVDPRWSAAARNAVYENRSDVRIHV